MKDEKNIPSKFRLLIKLFFRSPTNLKEKDNVNKFGRRDVYWENIRRAKSLISW